MRRVWIYLLHVGINVGFCLLAGYIAVNAFKIDWGAGVALLGTIFVVLGLIWFTNGATSTPYVVLGDSSNSSSIDSSSLRDTATTAEAVNHAELGADHNRFSNSIKKARELNLLALIFRRTPFEFISSGIVGICIGMYTYIDYFM